MTEDLLTELREYLEYDETSESCLRWVKKPGRGTAVGTLAGSVCPTTGYYVVGFRGKGYAAHTIVHALHNGVHPKGMVIDHINGIRTSNKIENLRLVTQKVNVRNAKMNCTNTSGAAGVRLLVVGGKYENFYANYFDDDGIRHSKSFSVLKYGYDEAFRLAKEWRECMVSTVGIGGEEYSYRHGIKEE